MDQRNGYLFCFFAWGHNTSTHRLWCRRYGQGAGVRGLEGRGANAWELGLAAEDFLVRVKELGLKLGSLEVRGLGG